MSPPGIMNHVGTINQRLQEHLHQSLENYIGLSDMFDKQCTTMNTVYAKLNQSRVLAKQLQRHIRLQRDRIIELELLLMRHDVSPPDMSEEYRCSSPPCPIESFEDAIPESNMRDSVYLPNWQRQPPEFQRVFQKKQDSLSTPVRRSGLPKNLGATFPQAKKQP